jgi:hypothetical protein
MFPKKVYLVTEKCEEFKNSSGGYPKEFAGSTQNPKKKFGISNQSERTFFQ